MENIFFAALSFLLLFHGHTFTPIRPVVNALGVGNNDMGLGHRHKFRFNTNGFLFEGATNSIAENQ